MLLNNLTMFLRYDKMCATLLTELDDGRYVNVPTTGRDDDQYVTFLQLDETKIATIPRNNRTSFQIISVKLKWFVKYDVNIVVLYKLCQEFGDNMDCNHLRSHCISLRYKLFETLD